METYIATFVSSYLIIALIVSAGFGLLAGWLAGQRGRSAGKFFALSFFCSFVIAIIVLLALPNLKTSPASASTSTEGLEKCPFCAELIKREAQVCKFCQRDVSEEFTLRREERMKEDRLASQRSIRLAQEEEASIAQSAELAARAKAESRERTRALIKTPKFIIAMSGLAAVVVGLSAFAVSENMKRDAAIEAELEAEAAATQQKVDAWMSEYGSWEKSIEVCKAEYPSTSIVSASASDTAGELELRIKFKDTYESVDRTDSTTYGFVNCVSSRLDPRNSLGELQSVGSYDGWKGISRDETIDWPIIEFYSYESTGPGFDEDDAGTLVINIKKTETFTQAVFDELSQPDTWENRMWPND